MFFNLGHPAAIDFNPFSQSIGVGGTQKSAFHFFDHILSRVSSSHEFNFFDQNLSQVGSSHHICS